MADKVLAGTTALAGLTVLVCRPAHQAQVLCDMISRQAGLAVKLPVMEIVPLWEQALQDLIQSIDAYDFAVFISPNAVEYGIRPILSQGKIPDKLKLVTIGRASAQKLQAVSGRAADIVPDGQYNSESLLAHKELQGDAVRNKKVIIFRGVGGRELLATVLRERGAEVVYAEVYRRSLPDYSTQAFRQIWAQQADIITLTSNESLHNLVSLCRLHLAESQMQQLWHTALLVVTDKMMHNARKLGFKADIRVAEKAGNESLLKALNLWLSESNNNQENRHGTTDGKATGKA